jgi:hypothetical protein
MPTSRTIRSALGAAIKTIKVAGGYLQNIPDANVFDGITPYDHTQVKDASAYPRVFIYSDGADYTDLPSSRVQKTELFTVLANFAKAQSQVAVAPTLQTMVDNFIDDFEKMVDRNKQLGGSNFAKLRACADDLGASTTEAVVMFELLIEYRRDLR